MFKEIRKKTGLSIKKVCELSGTPYRTWQGWETKDNPPPIAMAWLDRYVKVGSFTDGNPARITRVSDCLDIAESIFVSKIRSEFKSAILQLDDDKGHLTVKTKDIELNHQSLIEQSFRMAWELCGELPENLGVRYEQ